jgi:hypothetical protein
MSDENLGHLFPNLTEGGYSLTSPRSPFYNCIAWAVQDVITWWEPDMMNNYYWPPGVPREYSLDAYRRAYETLGFTECLNAHLEEGFEKIAIYIGSDGEPTHAARQLASGKWTSKLGKLEDIEHSNLECLQGEEYGVIGLIMKRII